MQLCGDTTDFCPFGESVVLFNGNKQYKVDKIGCRHQNAVVKTSKTITQLFNQKALNYQC